MSAKKATLWIGFLDAGSKGSPVVREIGMETGNRDTIYLFNFLKGKILEYRRDIVEPKLRELTADEQPMVPEIRKAFKDVREAFEPRSTRMRLSPPRTAPKRREVELSDFVDDVELDFDPNMPVIADDGEDGEALDQLE
jgi:hypothetical protein